MAHHKSAKKRIRRNERARARNKGNMSAVRTAVKALRTEITSVAEGGGSKEKLPALYQQAQRLLAKAITKGLIHRNTANRSIGRLAKTVNLANAGELKITKTKKKKK